MVGQEVRRSAWSGYRDSTAITIETFEDLFLDWQVSHFLRCTGSKEDMSADWGLH